MAGGGQNQAALRQLAKGKATGYMHYEPEALSRSAKLLHSRILSGNPPWSDVQAQVPTQAPQMEMPGGPMPGLFQPPSMSAAPDWLSQLRAPTFQAPGQWSGGLTQIPQMSADEYAKMIRGML